MKQPTEPPLTSNERAALTDLITQAARTLPTDSDRKRLIRLHRLDRADRKQERHTAGNVAFQLGAARAGLAAVLALHKPVEFVESWTCAECSRFGSVAPEWPCVTAVAAGWVRA